MDHKKKYIARADMIAKGIVYSLIGILTALAAFGQGGQESGSTESISFLSRQSFGQVLIVILGVGLASYAFWRIYQALANPQASKNDAKGCARRAGYFISGLIYAGLSVYALFHAFSRDAGGGNHFSKLLSGSNSDIIAIIVAIGLLIKAVFELYRAYSGDFRKEVEETKMSRREQKLLINAGKFGHTARGIVLGLMAYLTLRTGASSGSEITSQTDAFRYIRAEFGFLVLGVIALGFIGYGIYMFIQARYPAIAVSTGKIGYGIQR